jgi:hypothetical protein
VSNIQRVAGLAAAVAIIFDGFVKLPLGFGDAAIAIIAVVGFGFGGSPKEY